MVPAGLADKRKIAGAKKNKQRVGRREMECQAARLDHRRPVQQRPPQILKLSAHERVKISLALLLAIAYITYEDKVLPDLRWPESG